MGTMSISLPDSLKAFVDEQVSKRGYSTSSEYVRELVRQDQDRLRLASLTPWSVLTPILVVNRPAARRATPMS